MEAAQLIERKALVDQRLRAADLALKDARRNGAVGRFLPRAQFQTLELSHARLQGESQALQAQLAKMKPPPARDIFFNDAFHDEAQRVLPPAEFENIRALAATLYAARKTAGV